MIVLGDRKDAELKIERSYKEVGCLFLCIKSGASETAIFLDRATSIKVVREANRIINGSSRS